MPNRYEHIRSNPFYKLPTPLPGVTADKFLLAMFAAFDTYNQVLDVEHRGLHWTDKRTGLTFYEGLPDVSIGDLMFNKEVRRDIKQAVKSRSTKSKPLSLGDYYTSLITRSIILQVLNPVHRKDWIVKLYGEYWRQGFMSKNFRAKCLDPQNAEPASRFFNSPITRK